jgi:hypothetical protein
MTLFPQWMRSPIWSVRDVLVGSFIYGILRAVWETLT